MVKTRAIEFDIGASHTKPLSRGEVEPKSPKDCEFLQIFHNKYI